jgi:rhodanese-related sulfurtransferase
MNRRTFLATGALAASALAGCLGDDGESSDPGTPVGADDEPTGTPLDVDTENFERKEVDGEMVPLAPVEVTHNWYDRGAARFVDARGEGQYEKARIEGAVWSPAPAGRPEDPVEAFDTDDRIVCYCGCPHHLSSLRAATLISNGYESVYVIDEGFFEWSDRGYPVTGTAVEASARVVRGQSDPAHAGEAVYATHEPTDQREAAFVGTDGSYELHIRFADLTPETELRIDAPDYTVVAPLATLLEGRVNGA